MYSNVYCNFDIHDMQLDFFPPPLDLASFDSGLCAGTNFCHINKFQLLLGRILSGLSLKTKTLRRAAMDMTKRTVSLKWHFLFFATFDELSLYPIPLSMYDMLTSIDSQFLMADDISGWIKNGYFIGQSCIKRVFCRL